MQNYDWYGAYDTPLNEGNKYKDNLLLDYTFEYPKIHDNVIRSAKLLAIKL